MRHLNLADEADRLEMATQLYERFCHDLHNQSDMARVRLVSGIQIALRNAAEGKMVEPPRLEPWMDFTSVTVPQK